MVPWPNHFTSVIDLRSRCNGDSAGGLFPAADIAQLRKRYVGGEFTDLLLLQ